MGIEIIIRNEKKNETGTYNIASQNQQQQQMTSTRL